MNDRILLKALIVLIISTGLNYLSIMIAPFASPDDLGQLAFIIVIFFPAAAFITGILSHRVGLGWLAAAFVSALSVATVILSRYNISGLTYVLTYAGIAIVGYLLSLGVDKIIKKIRK